VIVAGVSVLVLGIASNAGLSPRVGFLAFSYSVIAFLLARYIEVRRRRFLLVYDVADQNAVSLGGLESAIEELAQSGRFRGVKTVGRSDDWKRSGGATRSLSFDGASLHRSAPPYVVTNLRPWRLSTQSMSLYFFPDRILIRKSGKFAAVSYSEIQVETHEGTFVWTESLPSDADVVGTTWQYVRRDGGPDRRFNNNRQIPLVRVGYVGIKSATGLQVVLQSTRCLAASAFERAHARYAAHVLGGARTSQASASPSETSHALSSLGLSVMPSADVLKQVYRELAQRNHPDRYNNAGWEIRHFADERMKEINHAYEVLLPSAGGAGSGDVVSPLETAFGAEAPVPLWRTPETGAVALALATCLALFVASNGLQQAKVAQVVPTVQPEPTLPRPTVEASSVLRGRVVYDCPLRSAPAGDAPRIARVSAGTEVDVLDSQRGWKKVRVEGQGEGWTGPRCWRLRPPRGPSVAKAKNADDEDANANQSDDSEGNAGSPNDRQPTPSQE
jgi:hypothetical protein